MLLALNKVLKDLLNIRFLRFRCGGAGLSVWTIKTQRSCNFVIWCKYLDRLGLGGDGDKAEMYNLMFLVNFMKSHTARCGGLCLETGSLLFLKIRLRF